MSAKPHYVYRAVDSSGRLLYVGCTNDVARRLSQHRAGSVWYRFMTEIDVSEPLSRATALDDEAAAIRDESPYFNAQPEHTCMVQANRNAASNLMFGAGLTEKDDDWYVARNAIGRLIRDQFPVVDDAVRLAWYKASCRSLPTEKRSA